MPKQSAGILLYRIIKNELQVLLVHPGGPFYKNKDSGTWSVPKGEFQDEEPALDAAKREFKEETGYELSGSLITLGSVKLKSGKTIYAWALEGNLEADKIVSNTFDLEWPPKSGKKQSFPEIDKAMWFDMQTARQKINAAQIPLIDAVAQYVSQQAGTI